jgi:hypothetical protein
LQYFFAAIEILPQKPNCLPRTIVFALGGQWWQQAAWQWQGVIFNVYYISPGSDGITLYF